MVYESSYESGMKPFRPDATRGYWSHPTDFLYACWGLAFKVDIFSMSWYFFFEMGLYSIIPHLICMSIYVVPIVLIQSFLGQFSSSGFISAFRLAPIFKGIGYISLAVNFSFLTYYGIFAAIPLIYFLHSLRPTLPWSCESYEKWAKESHDEDVWDLCKNRSTGDSESRLNYTWSFSRPYTIPSVQFFRSLFDYKFGSLEEKEFSFAISWQLLFCCLVVWGLVALIFYKIVHVEKLGVVIRHTIWLLSGILLVCVTRLLFLTDTKEALIEYFVPRYAHILYALTGIPIAAISSFGAGWGTIVSLASYNRFKTNIMRFSWFICIGQFVIMIMFWFANFLIDRHFTDITNSSYYGLMEQHWVMFLSSANAFVDIELANMWSLLYYGMLVISAVLVIVTELFSLLTALFDDFEDLRKRKQEVTFGVIGLLALCSIYFCSNHGLTYFTALPADALFTQTALNLLLLLVVLWVYGRVRFQRDIEFMLGQRFATWRVYMLRFVAPLALLLALLMGCTVAYYEHYISSAAIAIMAIFLIGIPWLFIPGYAILRIFQTSGTIVMRFRRCCRPTDWYPVDPEERQRYEEAMGNMDITHQLNEVGEEELS